MSELERLKANLEVLEQYHGYAILENARADLADKIARLEAEAADPWRDARERIEAFRTSTDVATRRQVAFVDHLTAENARLTARVAELEAAAKAEDEADLADAEKALADMIPPFEGPIESIEPVLDPARVLLTAIGILVGEREFRASASISDAMFRLGISADKPYRLKGADK